MLVDQYISKHSKKDEWRYYHKMNYNVFPFKSSDNAKEFIKQYFKTGEKDSIFSNKCIEEISDNRVYHTVSLFFLGIFLRPLFEKKIDELYPGFLYYWFLTSLFHDYGYSIENDKGNYIPKQINICQLKEKLGISDYSLFNQAFKSNIKVIGDSEQTINIDNGLIINYYDYCRLHEKLEFINHGIVGGLLLYHGLCENFEEKRKLAKDYYTNFNEESFYYPFESKIHWSRSHEKNYRFVAESIISHNIFFASKAKEKKVYKEYGLEKLILSEGSKVNYDAFLFLLVLADTIEPIKHFNQINPKCVLEKIDISVDEIKKTISIKILDECLNSEKYFEKILDLKNWLNVKDVELTDKEIKILL